MNSAEMRMAIHPFPARMAPDVALQAISHLGQGSTVLDPMSGSGTVLRAALANGCKAVGFDIDPLAVLISRVATTPLDLEGFEQAALDLVRRAQRTQAPTLAWIDKDEETRKFVDYWFGSEQQLHLRRLAYCLSKLESPFADALKVALSRIIVTKDRGASLARDVSHSRPHKVAEDNDFDVFTGFSRAARHITKVLSSNSWNDSASVEAGDARNLHVPDQSVDAVVTSPPYLNAIDYLRGHRMALVWLGFRIIELRQLRSDSIGSERGPDSSYQMHALSSIASELTERDALSPRIRRMFHRYLFDLYHMLSEVKRVAKPSGCAIFVIGNSMLRGVFVDNARSLTQIANLLGLTLLERYERELPPSNRYLPPPQATQGRHLTKRMRTEVVLRFVF